MNTPFNLPIDIFISKDKIGKIKAPIFIMHGTIDQVINVNHGRDLFGLINKRYAFKVYILVFILTSISHGG
jgi:hypothetical protein